MKDQAAEITSRIPTDTGRRAKHVQLRMAIKESIKQGVWKPGEKLPTETELAGSLPFSLGTIQRCFRDLVDEGIVIRKRGYGTYIPPRIKELFDPWHMRFLADDGKGFLPVYAHVLRRYTISGHGRWSEYLGQRSEKILRIDRRMQIGEEFSVYARFYACIDRVAKLGELPLEALHSANIKKLIAAEFNTQLATARHYIKQATIPVPGCFAIGVPVGTPAILVSCAAFFGSGPAVYYQEFFVPPTSRKLFLESRLGLGL